MKNHNEIDGEVFRMISKKGFVDLFWEKFKLMCQIDPRTRKEDAFNLLNEKYFKAIGEYRYSNYESFRRRMNDADQTRK